MCLVRFPPKGGNGVLGGDETAAAGEAHNVLDLFAAAPKNHTNSIPAQREPPNFSPPKINSPNPAKPIIFFHSFAHLKG